MSAVEEGVLDRLPGVLVELVAGEQGEQAAAEAALGAGQPLPEPEQPGRRALRLLELRLDRHRGGLIAGASTGASVAAPVSGGGAMTSVPGGCGRRRRPLASSPTIRTTPRTAMPMIR